MLDKNNSILWDGYRSNKHNYENETLQQYTLSMAMCIDIDNFINQHNNFDGEKELFAIRGMVNPKVEKYQAYAAAYNNDIVVPMGIVRPKLRKILIKDAVDPTALIMYAMTGMFLELGPNEGDEVNHILLTLLQYETMGVDVSGCKELWGHFAYTQEFESGYDTAQIEGGEVKPITFEEKRLSAGFLTESAQSTVAEFVFMNMSNLDKDWMNLFYEDPVFASGIISIKKGISADLWEMAIKDDNGESKMAPYEEYRNLIITDTDKAIDVLTFVVEGHVAIYGGSFITDLLLADLICLVICEGKTIEGSSQKMLDACIEYLEDTNTFPEGATLENVLYALHRESNLPELYFLFFTVFYATDYGNFRSIAKNMYSKYC